MCDDRECHGEAGRHIGELRAPPEIRTQAEIDAWKRGISDAMAVIRAAGAGCQPAPAIDPDYYVIQRDPARVGPVLADIRGELERRLREGHMLKGASLEAEAAWLAGNADSLDRKALLEAAAGAVEQVVLWDLGLEAVGIH